MTRKRKYLDDNPPTSNKTKEELIKELEYRHSKKGQKELKKKLQEEQDNKISEFGSINTPKSNELQYAWRRFTNSKGSELLYAMPGVGEVMFGVDVADKAKQNDNLGVLTDMLLYGAMTYAPEIARGIKKGGKRIINRISKRLSRTKPQVSTEAPTVNTRVNVVPEVVSEVVENSANNHLPTYTELRQEFHDWDNANVDAADAIRQSHIGHDDFWDIRQIASDDFSRKFNSINDLVRESQDIQYGYSRHMSDEEYLRRIQEGRDLYQRWQTNPESFQIPIRDNQPSRPFVEELEPRFRNYGNDLDARTEAYLEQIANEGASNNSRRVHHLDTDYNIPSIETYPYNKQTEILNGKTIHYLGELSPEERAIAESQFNARTINTANGPIKVYDNNGVYLKQLSPKDKRGAYYVGLTPAEAQNKLNADFENIPHGSQAALIDHFSLSSDSYPLFIKESLRRQAKGEGYLDMVTDADGNPIYQMLNSMGKTRKNGRQIDRLQLEKDFVDYANRRMNIQIPQPIEYEGNILVPSLKFYKFKLGGSLNNRHSLKHGGIYIKPSHRGRFTALKERTGHSASWFKENGTPAQKKMATFALNAAKWKH